MNIIGLDGKEYRINFNKSRVSTNCSKLHIRARDLLHTEFPYDKIYEEVALPGTKNERQIKPLMADFIIPLRYIIVEVQGEQHYKHNSFFYYNKLEFYKAQSRDRNKVRWCELNQIKLICLPFNENDGQWLERIRNR
jgi:hypothetical protein